MVALVVETRFTQSLHRQSKELPLARCRARSKIWFIENETMAQVVVCDPRVSVRSTQGLSLRGLIHATYLGKEILQGFVCEILICLT